MHKYGREFSAAVMENRNGCVSERVRLRELSYPIFDNLTEHSMFQVMKKLANDMPSANLVEGYLTEIARGYAVRWTPDPKQVGDDQRCDGQDFVVSYPSTLSTSLPVRSYLLGYGIAICNRRGRPS